MRREDGERSEIGMSVAEQFLAGDTRVVPGFGRMTGEEGEGLYEPMVCGLFAYFLRRRCSGQAD